MSGLNQTTYIDVDSTFRDRQKYPNPADFKVPYSNNRVTNTIDKAQNILSDSYYVNYLQNKNKLFNTIFKHHYVDKKKYFVKLDKLESFSLSWLMYLYH